MLWRDPILVLGYKITGIKGGEALPSGSLESSGGDSKAKGNLKLQ